MFLVEKFLFCASFALIVNSVPINEPDSETQALLSSNVLPIVESRFNVDEEEESVRPEAENGVFFQGDIKLVKDQEEYLLSEDEAFPTRTGWNDEDYRWPKDDEGKVNVPFQLSPRSKFSKYQVEERKLPKIHKTCFHFS
jgi:hypothetical protein